MRIKFTDGIEFNTSGLLRVERRSDGYYVVGDGMLIPVDSREEGEREIEQIARDRAKRE
jgi:hypothetical protein